jgi:Flp pilus assembly protein TadD
MHAIPSKFAVAGLIAAQILVSGCASVGGAHGLGLKGGSAKAAAQKRADAQDAAPNSREQARIDKRARADIEHEDILTQMTFWAREQAIHPDDAETALKFSEVLRKGGRADRAAEIAGQALERTPDNRGLLRAYGLALIGSGRSGEALRPLALLCEADPKDARARTALGVALDEQGRFDEARQAYREALAIKADDVATLTDLGVSYLLTGDAAKAENVLRQAAALPAAGPETRQNLALAVGLQGKFGEAEQLQRVDLPEALVANNMAYLRSLLTDGRRWGDVRGTRRE